MKRKLLFVWTLFCFLLSSSLCTAAEGISINGYDWQKWSRGSKLAFVQGWAICGKSAYDNLILDLNKWDESFNFLKLQEEGFKDAGILLGGVTIGQIIDTIDKIYSDPRVTTMDISAIMPFVSGRLIQGWSEKELDEITAIYVRLNQCEKKENIPGSFENCSSLRKERNAYLQKIKRK
ncbi:MAG: hypothetical protein PHE15_04650 [Dehalococcoidales bacterium]|nr:hypothetical protein [Dehalococcoidales bacterium]